MEEILHAERKERMVALESGEIDADELKVRLGENWSSSCKGVIWTLKYIYAIKLPLMKVRIKVHNISNLTDKCNPFRDSVRSLQNGEVIKGQDSGFTVDELKRMFGLY